MSLDIKTFLQMGGYAFYVWSAYGVVLASLCVNALLSRRYFNRVMRAEVDAKEESRDSPP